MAKYTFVSPAVVQAQQTQTYVQQQVTQVQQSVQQQVEQVQHSVDAQVDEVQLDYATLEQLATKQDKGDYALRSELATKQDAGAYLDPTALQPVQATLQEHDTRITANTHQLSTLGTLSTKNAVSYTEVTDTPVLGALASKDHLQYNEIQNLPTLGWLAAKNTLNYLELAGTPQLGSLAGRNSLNYSELLGAPDISGLTTRVSTAETTISSNTTAINSNTTNLAAAVNNITTLTTRLGGDESSITANAGSIVSLSTRVGTAETNITANSNAISTNTANLGTASSNVSALTSRVANDEATLSTHTTRLAALGTMANKSTVDYAADVINKPTLGTLAAKNSIDYVNDILNKPTLYQSPMYRNRIINGDFSVMQRIHSGTLDVVWADRWVLTSTTATTSSGPWPTQSRLGPGNSAPGGTAYYMRVSTFSNSTVATSELQRLVQVIEGGMVQDLEWGTSQGKPMVLSFWTHHSLVGTYSVTIRQANPTSATTAQSFVAEYQQISTSAWEQKVISIPPPPAGTAWVSVNNENLGAIEIAFVLNGSGSANATSTIGSWISPTNSTIGCSTNQINLWTLSTTSNQSLRIAAVQFEPGTVNTPFEWRPRSIEETLCKRYCQMVVANQTYACVGTGYFWSTTAAYVMLDLQVNLRDPVNYGIAVSKPSDWCVQSATGAGVFPFSTLGIAGQTQCGTSLMLYGTLSVAGTQNAPCLMTANNTTAAYIRFSAEFSPPSL